VESFPLQYENREDRYKYLPNRIITYQEVYKFMKKISPPTRYKGIKFKIDDPPLGKIQPNKGWFRNG